jgi:hypothetical protein
LAVVAPAGLLRLMVVLFWVMGVRSRGLVGEMLVEGVVAAYAVRAPQPDCIAPTRSTVATASPTTRSLSSDTLDEPEKPLKALFIKKMMENNEMVMIDLVYRSGA